MGGKVYQLVDQTILLLHVSMFIGFALIFMCLFVGLFVSFLSVYVLDFFLLRAFFFCLSCMFLLNYYVYL